MILVSINRVISDFILYVSEREREQLSICWFILQMPVVAKPKLGARTQSVSHVGGRDRQT